MKQIDDYKKKIIEWYDSISERYDSWGQRDGEFSTETKSEEMNSFNHLLSCIDIKKDSKILDIATGTGAYLIAALKKGGVGYGVDLSNKMLEQLKRNAERLGFENRIFDLKKSDAENIPFDSNFFDIILCIGLFDYYPFDVVSNFLNEIKRVSKKDCLFIVDFPNKDNKEVYVFQNKERSVGHDVFIYSLDELKNFIYENGFDIITMKEVGIEVQMLLKRR